MMKHHSKLITSGRLCSLLLSVFLSVALFRHEVAISHTDDPELTIGVGRAPHANKVQYNGYLYPILKELFLRSGIELNLVAMPVGRSLDETNAGNLDGVITPFESLDARFTELLTLPVPFASVEFSGLYIHEDVVIETVDDFLDYRLAYIRDWKPAEKLFEQHRQTEKARNPEVLMSMLKHDRVDVVYYSTFVGKNIAKKIGIDKLKVTDFYHSVPVYLHLNKRHANLLPDIEKQLAGMMNDGTLDSILSEYGVRQSR